MADAPQPFRGWLYAERGDYHRDPHPDWSYTPTYLRKMALVSAFLSSLPASERVLDAGCGEGVLVEALRSAGRQAEGIDLNYEAEHVHRGDVRALPYNPGSFEVVVLLDVLEHLPYADQGKALAEANRVLKGGGHLVLSVPNLAHLNSRVRFLLRGQLDRADNELDHPGERPVAEVERLLTAHGFTVDRRLGVTLTVPLLYRRLICRRPRKMRWLHDLLDPLARALPSLSLVVVFFCTSAAGGEAAPNGS